jgi:hypothetical protein
MYLEALSYTVFQIKLTMKRKRNLFTYMSIKNLYEILLDPKRCRFFNNFNLYLQPLSQ